MLVCDKFIFLHLHKSGGTFVNQLMMTCLPGVRKLGYHLPASEIPPGLRHLPVLGTVRGPFGYYVSWYHFQHGLAKRNALFELCSDGGRLGFASTIERLVTLESRPLLIDALVAAFPDDYVGSGLNLTKHCIARIADSKTGFYTFLHDRLYRDAPRATILRAEELRSALGRFLAPLYPERPLWREFLEHAPDMNRSRHGAIGDYYPGDLGHLIETFDRPIFDRYGYSPSPDSAARQADGETP